MGVIKPPFKPNTKLNSCYNSRGRKQQSHTTKILLVQVRCCICIKHITQLDTTFDKGRLTITLAVFRFFHTEMQRSYQPVGDSICTHKESNVPRSIRSSIVNRLITKIVVSRFDIHHTMRIISIVCRSFNSRITSIFYNNKIHYSTNNTGKFLFFISKSSNLSPHTTQLTIIYLKQFMVLRSRKQNDVRRLSTNSNGFTPFFVFCIITKTQQKIEIN